MGRISLCAVVRALAVMAVCAGSARVHAVMITFDTPLGATNPGDGKPVSATATFTTLADEIHISVENLLANPTAVSQSLSSLAFAISSGQTAGSLTSSSAEQILINDKVNPFVSLGPQTTGWAYDSTGAVLPGVRLRVLGGPPALGPSRTLIGPSGPGNVYSNAGGSIAGNGPHNPFNTGVATFVLSIPGVTADSSISNVIFQFGTTDGTGLIPEPSSVLLLSCGMLGLLHRRRRA